MPSDQRTPLLLRAAAYGGLLFLNLPVLIIVMYAFTTEESTYQFPPPGLTFKWFAVAAGRQDIFAALFLSLKVAARMIEDGELDKRVAKRYAGWNGELGQQILNGQMTLSDIAQYAAQHQLAPQHRSGQQEQLENLVNHYLFDK